MGMYTELIFGAELKRETPKEVIETLRYMIGDVEEKPKNFPFESFRNPLLGGSFYFAVSTAVSKMWQEKVHGVWRISTRANIKNYDGEIEEFLKWITPWIDSGSGYNDMYAIVIYEESTEPTIYYLHND